MKKIITQLGKARFRLVTVNIPNSQIILDFNPLIHKFQLKGEFSLIHWQARPKKYREWGIYNSVEDSYSSIPDFKIEGIFTSLQIPDVSAYSLPSAVLMVRHPRGDSLYNFVPHCLQNWASGS